MRTRAEQLLHYGGIYEGCRSQVDSGSFGATILSTITENMRDLPETRAQITYPAKMILRNAFEVAVAELRGQVFREEVTEVYQADVIALVIQQIPVQAEVLQIGVPLEPIVQFITENNLISAIATQLDNVFAERIGDQYTRSKENQISVQPPITTAHGYLHALQAEPKPSSNSSSKKAA